MTPMEWMPLAESWRRTRGRDRKFEGLSLMAVQGVDTPTGAMIFATPDSPYEAVLKMVRSAVIWITTVEGRSTAECDRRNVPLMLSVRFGDKHIDPGLAPSVSFIGAEDRSFSEEYEAQRRAFETVTGYDIDTTETDAVEQAAQIGFHGLQHAPEQAGREIAFLVQRTACGIGLPRSGHGTCYTRHPQTGQELDYGRYKWQVSGRLSDTTYSANALQDGQPTKSDLTVLRDEDPEVYWQLRSMLAAIDNYFEDTRFVEFVIEAGKVYIVQCTPRKRLKKTYVPLTRELLYAEPELPAFDFPDDPVWKRSIRNSDLCIEISADNPTQAEQASDAIATLNVHGTSSECERWHVHWFDVDAPDIPGGCGDPLSIERSNNGRHLVGRCLAGSNAIYIDRDRALFRMEPDERRIAIVGRPRQKGGAGLLLRLTLRDLWRGYVEGHGGLLLHAAAVLLHGQAWLLLGPKGAGKTTLQLALVEQGAGFVSSDRIFVDRAGMVQGWPGSLRVAASAIDHHFPEFGHRIRAVSPAQSVATGKHQVEARDVARLFPTFSSGRYPLAGYVLVDRREDRDGWSLSRVAPQDADALLAEHTFDRKNDPQRHWLGRFVPRPLCATPVPRDRPVLTLAGGGSPHEAAWLVSAFAAAWRDPITDEAE